MNKKEEEKPHPDTSVAHDGRVRCALCVDMGLGVMNGTLHLAEDRWERERVIKEIRNSLSK